jgi:L-asparagine transporter-like permease
VRSLCGHGHSGFTWDGVSRFVSAFIVAVFGYWGWDIAYSLNEEIGGDAGTPTRSAISTLFSLVILYVISVVVFIAYAGETFISENSELLLDALGGNVLGVIGAKLLVILVLTSGIAATQATIIPATRTLLSMGAFGAMPKRFGRVNRFETPGFATIVYGIISALVFVALTAISVDVLFDSLSSTGMLICFYYGLSGVGCAWYFRDTLTKSLAGGTVENITRLTWFVTDKAEYLSAQTEVGGAYREIFGKHYPAMSMVVVAGLVEDEAKVEIEATAQI